MGMESTLNGRKALVTGGASGIGAACVRELAARGAKVVVADVDLLGDRVRVALEGPVPVVAEVTTAAFDELGLRPGTRLWASVKATEVEAYPA